MRKVSRNASPATVIFVGIIFVVTGFFVMRYGQSLMKKAKASLEWPTTPGVVVESEVVRSRNKDGGKNYHADVVYEYFVDGAKYLGDDVRAGSSNMSSSNSGGAHKITNTYPKGREVTVYYDPASPQDAVLEPGVFMETKFAFWFGVVFIAMGALMSVGVFFGGMGKHAPQP